MKHFIFSLTLSFAAVTAVTIHSETANAQNISCSSASACALSGLPAYNQNSAGLLATSWNVGGRTNLGSPSAASMLLTSLINNGLTVKPGTVTANFKPKTANAKTTYTAGLMSTSITTGTVTNKLASFIIARKTDFDPAVVSGTAYNSATSGIAPSVILNSMKAGRAALFTYGIYQMTCTVVASNVRRCTYARNGGVVVPVRSINGANVTVVDPAGAAVKTYAITRIPTKASDGYDLEHVLPAAFSVNTCYVLDNTSRFIEHISSLGI